MNIDGLSAPAGPGLGAGPLRKPRTPDEAARQFEEVLVRQFVGAMTSGLFKSNLAGDEGPAWISSNQDTQREMLTDILASHLVEQGAFRLSDMLRRQMGAAPAEQTSPDPSR